MPQLTHQCLIAAPPELVWPVLADITNWPQWTPTVLRARALRPAAPVGEGSGFRLRQPKTLPATWRITVWQPHEVVWVSAGLGYRARPIWPLVASLVRTYVGLEVSRLKEHVERGARRGAHGQ